MKARELAQPYPVVRTSDPATSAARLLAGEDIDVVLVQDERGVVVGPLHDLDVLDALLPRYLVEDRVLARVLEPGASEGLWARLEGRTVGDLLRRYATAQPTVDGDADLVEIAAEMLSARAALVAVVEGTTVLGGITSSALLTHLLGP